MRLAADVLRDPGEHDPLDSQFGPLPAAETPVRSRWWRGRSPGGRVVLVLLPLGMALGPEGLNVLSPPVLSALDPVVSVIVGVLGVIVGLGLDVRRSHERRLLGGAALEAAIAAVIVAGGAFAVLTFVLPGSTQFARPAAFAALIGLCAALSALPAEPSPGVWLSPVSRLRAMGSVLPIVGLGLLVAWLRDGSAPAATLTTVQAGLISLTIAAAAWVLVGQTASDSEQRVLAAGALLLVSGAAEFLSLSALFAGLVAGAAWQAFDGQARDHLARDTRYAQHPMMAVLLIVAGALVRVGPGLPVLLAAYVICRTAGKILGGWMVRRTIVRSLPRELGLHLASPGVVAIAMAFDARSSAGAEAAAWLLPVVVLGTLASEVLSMLFAPAETAPLGEAAR